MTMSSYFIPNPEILRKESVTALVVLLVKRSKNPLSNNFAIIYFIPTGEEQQLNVFGTVISVIFITIIPVAIGMMVLKKSPQLAQKWDAPFRKISAIFFVVILLAAILKERENLIEYFAEAGPVALALNLATLGLGYFSGKIFGLSKKQSTTIAIESGIQNGTLGITIAATLLMNSIMTIPSAIYGLLMFGTAGVVIFIGNRKSTAQAS
jgi:BASS family bile acid:Na+ symporter